MIDLTLRLCTRCKAPLEINLAPQVKFCTGCKAEKKKEHDKARNALVRRRGAALNGGLTLGKHCRSLRERLSTLVVKPFAKCAQELQCTPESVRTTELRVLNDLRSKLDPFGRCASSKDFLHSNLSFVNRGENVRKERAKHPLVTEGEQLLDTLRAWKADLLEAGDLECAAEVQVEIEACEGSLHKLELIKA